MTLQCRQCPLHVSQFCRQVHLVIGRLSPSFVYGFIVYVFCVSFVFLKLIQVLRNVCTVVTVCIPRHTRLYAPGDPHTHAAIRHTRARESIYNLYPLYYIICRDKRESVRERLDGSRTGRPATHRVRVLRAARCCRRVCLVRSDCRTLSRARWTHTTHELLTVHIPVREGRTEYGGAIQFIERRHRRRRRSTARHSGAQPAAASA